MAGNTPQKTSSNLTARRIDSSGRPVEQMTLGKNVDQQILQLVSSGFSEQVVRSKFVQMATNTLGATGVCYLSRNLQDLWLPTSGQPKAGRLPDGPSLAGQFSERCDVIAQSAGVQAENVPNSELTALLAPISPSRTETQLLCVILQRTRSLPDSAAVLKKMAAALQLWLNSQTAADADWQVNSLSAIIEIVSKVENQPTNKAAAEELSNLIAKQTNCSTVAIGLSHGAEIELAAISGISKIDHGSRASRDYLAALNESVVRKTAGLFPATDPEDNHLLHAHRQLCSCLQSEAAFSFPLVAEDERTVGAVVMTGSGSQLVSSQLQRFTGAASPAFANALSVVNRAKQTRVRLLVSYIGKLLKKQKFILGLTAVCCVVGAMFIPMTYRVRCNCTAEPVTRRFAVAPFAGQIVSGSVEPGDLVKKDQVLAELDGRLIRWELAGVTAERDQSLRSREMELSSGNIPKVILAELEHQRLASEESILEYKRDHLLVRSPIDGVVLSGSVERAEAASVETGQVLFEIGPTRPMRIEVAVPSEEIAQVKTGFPVKIWIEGQEDRPLEGTVARIHPRSETRDARNVFIAEIEVPNAHEELRPGMNGSVRIDCEKRSLGWALFHKPVNYVRSKLTWW